MGIALIIRPDFREQVFGTKKDVKKAIPMNADSVSADKKIVLQEVQKVASEGVQAQSVASDAAATEQASESQPILDKEVDEKEPVRDLIYEIGFRPHPSP